MKFLLYTLEWILEFILILIHFPCYLLLKYVPIRPKKSTQETLPSIIIVERWFRRNVFHFFAKRYLEKQGFRVYNVNFSLHDGSFENSGKKLKDYIEERSLKNIVLLGISGGSLTCLEYLQNNNGWDRTRLFISLAGPFKGSWIAKFFPIDHSIREMEPGSQYLHGLFEKPIQNKHNIYSIHGKADNMVPVESSCIDGVRNITIDVVGHNLLHGFWFPTYKKVYEIIKDS